MSLEKFLGPIRSVLRRMVRKIARGFGAVGGNTGEVPIPDRKGYETVFDDDSMTVLMIPGRQEDCIVSFTGVGYALGGIDLQSPEFARSDTDEIKIFVIDKQRSWGNNIDWDKLKILLEPLTRGARITTLGNSMGGFLAILAAGVLGADHAIAFAPQWSIDPEIVPDEKRWTDYVDRISYFRHSDLSTSFEGPAKFFVFFGDDPSEATHLNFFAQQRKNLDLIVVKGCGHDVARFLKENGKLYPAINACRTGGDVRHLLREANISLNTV